MKHQPARVGGGLRVQPRRNDDGADRGDQRSVKLQQSVLAEFGPVETVGKGGKGGNGGNGGNGGMKRVSVVDRR
jgi:hypothetical protein